VTDSGVTDNCIFCAIVAGRAPARVLAEDDTSIAFLDIFPITRGHALAIPKRHYQDVRDLPADELAAAAAMAQRLAVVAFTDLGADGVNLFQSNGALAFQTIFHFHIHVLPRYRGDGFNLTFGRNPGDPAALDEDLARYRAALA
jgi:histidine triad (HIT) family protein